jgi:hypothetical protein
VQRLITLLDRHWFARASLRDLALVRILAFGSQTLYFVHQASLPGQLALARAPESLYRPIVALKALLLPWGGWGDVRPSPSFLAAAWTIAVVAGVLATIGLYARVAMLAAAAANTLLITHWYSYGEFHHREALMIIALGVLALAPSAEAWSVDAARRRRRPRERAPEPGGDGDLSVFARWPLRLIQWLVALTYLSAAWSKLHLGGLRWINGYTLAFHFLSEGVSWERPVALFMASLPPWVHIAPSVLTILFESTFFVAVLVPRTTWIYVLAGIGFHLAIWVTQGPLFLQTIVLYSAFAESLRLYWPTAFRPAWARRRQGGRPEDALRPASTP